MSAKDPSELAEYLKSKKNVLLLTGASCEEIELDGKMLLDYAAELASKTNFPVAATGNTAKPLKAKGIENIKKRFLVEIVDQMRGPAWRDSLMSERPELLVFIGYSPMVVDGLLSSVKGAETMVLGNEYTKEATYCLPDASLAQYERNLKQLIQAMDN